MLISTENDFTVHHSEVLKMHEANRDLFKLITYTKDQKIKHDNIQRTPLDLEANAPKEWSNPYFTEILLQIDKSFIFN